MSKFCLALSLGAISTVILSAPAFANPSISYGQKGTYIVNDDLSYRGCLYSGGCIVLGRKYLMKRMGSEDESMRWKKGEYMYILVEGYIFVYKNDRLIFKDSALSTRP